MRLGVSKIGSEISDNEDEGKRVELRRVRDNRVSLEMSFVECELGGKKDVAKNSEFRIK